MKLWALLYFELSLTMSASDWPIWFTTLHEFHIYHFSQEICYKRCSRQTSYYSPRRYRDFLTCLKIKNYIHLARPRVTRVWNYADRILRLFQPRRPHTHTRAVFVSHERTTKTILDFREWLFTPTSGHEGHLLPSVTHWSNSSFDHVTHTVERTTSVLNHHFRITKLRTPRNYFDPKNESLYNPN